MAAQRRAAERGIDVIFFGGVAFKYQRAVLDVERAAGLASGLLDVICTSGPATGQQADPNKTAWMRAGAGDTPLGLASGVSAGNVGDYLPEVDVFLVASSVCSSFTEFDPAKLGDLVAAVTSARLRHPVC